MKFKANRQISGDYGLIPPGGVFEVPDFQAKKLQHLEARGVIERYRPPRDFGAKAYTVYENKALQAPIKNKSK